YRALNFCALWKKQTTLSSLAYAGIPYQVRGVRMGAAALTTAWTRLAILLSGSDISSIFASTALSPSVSAPDFISRTRSFIAARSSAVNPLDFWSAFFGACRVAFFGGMGGSSRWAVVGRRILTHSPVRTARSLPGGLVAPRRAQVHARAASDARGR